MLCDGNTIRYPDLEKTQARATLSHLLRAHPITRFTHERQIYRSHCSSSLSCHSAVKAHSFRTRITLAHALATQRPPRRRHRVGVPPGNRCGSSRERKHIEARLVTAVVGFTAARHCVLAAVFRPGAVEMIEIVRLMLMSPCVGNGTTNLLLKRSALHTECALIGLLEHQLWRLLQDRAI
jgi:hypothetical protein